VLTGITSPEETTAPGIQADEVFETLADLHAAWAANLEVVR
jgi:hypothetical protein